MKTGHFPALRDAACSVPKGQKTGFAASIPKFPTSLKIWGQKMQEGALCRQMAWYLYIKAAASFGSYLAGELGLHA